jgi:hypothetical protein
MLTIAAIAVAAGARSMAAIGECAAEASQDMLRVVGARYDPRQARFVAPGGATLRRALSGVDGDELDAAVSAWILDRTTPEHATSDSDVSDGDVSDSENQDRTRCEDHSRAWHESTVEGGRPMQVDLLTVRVSATHLRLRVPLGGLPRGERSFRSPRGLNAQ